MCREYSFKGRRSSQTTPTTMQRKDRMFGRRTKRSCGLFRKLRIAAGSSIAVSDLVLTCRCKVVGGEGFVAGFRDFLEAHILAPFNENHWGITSQSTTTSRSNECSVEWTVRGQLVAERGARWCLRGMYDGRKRPNAQNYRCSRYAMIPSKFPPPKTIKSNHGKIYT